jgi:hypothetical protein
MTIQEAVYAAITTNMAGRVYPNRAPQTVTLPYATYSVISQIEYPSLAGLGSLNARTRVQIDVVAATYTEAQTRAATVRADLHAALGAGAHLDSWQDLFDDETRLYRVAMDWILSHALSMGG